MRTGLRSQDEGNKAKTFGRRRHKERIASGQSPQDKQILGKQKAPKDNGISGKLINNSSLIPLEQSIDSESIGGVSKNGRSATFGGEEDFIPFELSDSPDEEESVIIHGRDWKGKGKGNDDEGRLHSRDTDGRREDGELADGFSRRENSRSDVQWDRDKGRRQHDWDDDRSRPRGHTERDRDGNHKRKYDEYQGDDRDSSTRQILDTASKKFPWIKGIDLQKCHNVAEILHCEVESFVDWISPTPAEDEIRSLIVEHITRTIKGPFPDAQVVPFGSYSTKLYLPTGDIDLVVLSDTLAHNDKTKALHIMATTLKRNGITSHVTIIAKAKVPILKFVSNHGRLQVDISINQANGLISGKIIAGFLNQMIPCAKEKESKALRSLIMITKAFLSQRKLNEVYTGGLGSYSVVCLAVSFLQMHPKIRRGEIDPEKNLGVLVVEFFELYGNRFNYDNVGISLREGGTYFNKRERGWNVDYKKNLLSIEDPADPSNDISSGSYHFHKVKTAFAGAYNLLTTTSYDRAGILNSRRQETSFRLRRQFEPEDLSVLSTVMRVTQETINHRRLVQELYEKRLLHRILGVVPKISTTAVVHHAEVRERSISPQNSRVIESAWTNGQLKDGSDHEDDYHRRHSNSYEQDGGRYDIGRHTSKKRRKAQRSEEHSIYFVTDRDSRDDLSEGELYDDGGEVYDGNRSRQANGISRDTRRNFWLGKAIDMGGLADNADR